MRPENEREIMHEFNSKIAKLKMVLSKTTNIEERYEIRRNIKKVIHMRKAYDFKYKPKFKSHNKRMKCIFKRANLYK